MPGYVEDVQILQEFSRKLKNGICKRNQKENKWPPNQQQNNRDCI